MRKWMDDETKEEIVAALLAMAFIDFVALNIFLVIKIGIWMF